MTLTAKRCYEYMITPKTRIWVGNDHHIRIQDGSTYKTQTTGVMVDKHMFTGTAKLIRK